MTFKDFKRSLAESAPPGDLSPALRALWWDGKGDWQRAHVDAQSDEGADCAWVHAYLHRKEGDSANAAYWYRRAARSPASSALEAEWADVAGALLGEAGRG